MKLRKKIKRLKKVIQQYIVCSILLIFILLGGWCLPPKWMGKVIDEMKSKYTVEKIVEDDKN